MYIRSRTQRYKKTNKPTDCISRFMWQSSQRHRDRGEKRPTSPSHWVMKRHGVLCVPVKCRRESSCPPPPSFRCDWHQLNPAHLRQHLVCIPCGGGVSRFTVFTHLNKQKTKGTVNKTRVWQRKAFVTLFTVQWTPVSGFKVSVPHE